MTDTEIRDALLRATDGLRPRPELLQDVRRQGRRVLVRRRTVLGAGLAATVAGSTAAVFTDRRGDGPVPADASLFSRPTVGDLAGDRAHLRQVLAGWQQYAVEHPEDPLSGRAHVLWAGSTPAGPAAFVVQRPQPGLLSYPGIFASFMESTPAGKMMMTRRAPWALEDLLSTPHAALLGERRDVLVVRHTDDATVRMSTALSHRSDGRIARTFARVPLTAGVAVLPVPGQRERITVALLSGPQAAPDPVYIDNVDDITTSAGRRTANGATYSRTLQGASAVWPEGLAEWAAEQSWAEPALRPYLDLGGYPPYTLESDAKILGGTPDGRRFMVRTEAVSYGRARVLLVLGRPDEAPRVSYVGIRSMSGPVQLALRLPDRQGVVVARPNATLRYRIGTRAWVDVDDGDAALLPDAVTEVEVRLRGVAPARVPVR